MATSVHKPTIVSNLYEVLSSSQSALTEVIWAQQAFHEHRRWSAVEMLEQVDVKAISDAEKVYVWNIARGELTTKPGADRLARLTDSECRRWRGRDDALASVIQACGTWSRYWNEEEAHHEAAFNHLARILGCEPITDETVIGFRSIFPDDDLLRTLFLLAISEIKATVMYATGSNNVADRGLRALLRQLAADEMQHMRYFISFARGIFDSGHYDAKEVLSVAHLFLRPGGELEGSARGQTETRAHVNWWDALDFSGSERPDNFERQRKLICEFVEQVTSIRVETPDQVEEKWLELVG